MSDLDLMMRARQEILALRRTNELLTAQMGIVEVFAAALGLRKGEHSMTEDVAWLLERRIQEIGIQPSE